MPQLARNATDGVNGFLRNTHYPIVDREPLYTSAFAKTLQATKCTLLRLPARSPNRNAFAERFILSIKSECIDRVVPLGEQHLRQLIVEYLAHYHRERHHQGLDNVPVSPTSDGASGSGLIV